MNAAKRLVFLLTVFLSLFIAETAHAALAFDEGTIYLDEDFEGGALFADQNFPKKESTSSPAVTLVRGINLRASSSSYATPKVLMGTAGGSVDSSRAYAGAKSYRLSPDRPSRSRPGVFPAGPTTAFVSGSLPSASTPLPARFPSPRKWALSKSTIPTTAPPT